MFYNELQLVSSGLMERTHTYIHMMHIKLYREIHKDRSRESVEEK